LAEIVRDEGAGSEEGLGEVNVVAGDEEGRGGEHVDEILFEGGGRGEHVAGEGGEGGGRERESRRGRRRDNRRRRRRSL
jgi:hypothetical protein